MADEREEISEMSSLMMPEGSPRASQVDLHKNKVCIMTAGKPASGKSTALNNIFDLQLETGISAHSVTRRIVPTKVSKNGAELVVIDTPGLGARDIDKEAIAMAMGEVVSQTDYTLLYCLSVAPSSRLTEEDETIIINLSKVLGNEVWNKCVLLFTFSDTAWRDEFAAKNDVERYKKHMEGMAAQFTNILNKCGPSLPMVKTVFEQRGDQYITAFPAGKERNLTGIILPGILEVADNRNWTDVVFDEIRKKTAKDQRNALDKLKYGAAVAGSAASAAFVGLVVGAGVGATAGAFAGPVGIVAAGGIGAAGGAAIGGATGLASAVLMAFRRWRKKSKIKQELLSTEAKTSK